MNKIRHSLFAFLSLVLLSYVVAAQDKKPLNINTGAINRKATSLVKPAYPPAAKAVRASGAVHVQVLIDEQGNVVSAAAVSGHPLLRAASVQAARESKFVPTLLQDQPVKVSGIIVYNFVGDDLTAAQIGFALGAAELSPELKSDTPVYQIAFSIPDERTEAKAEAAKLQAKQNQVAAKKHQESQEQTNQISADNQSNSAERQGVQYARRSRVAGVVSEEVKESHTEIIGNLINFLKNGYAGNGKSWEFLLGLKLGKLQAQLTDESALRANLNELNAMAQTAPASVSSDLVNSLKTITSIADKVEIGAAEKAEIENFLRRIK